MANEENKKSYVNPDFTSAFKRVKDILDDLKNKVMPVKQGNAVNFRENINKAIGTIPEFEKVTESEEATNINIKTDGSGMSGAVFAMGEAFEIGLSNLGDALNQFDTDAQDILKNATDILGEATESKNTILEYKSTTEGLKNTILGYEEQSLASKNAILGYEEQSLASKNTIDNILTQVDYNFTDANKKFEQALADAAGNANEAADRANSAAQGITNTFVCLAPSDPNQNMPVDSNGNIITQSIGGLWLKELSST